MKLNKLSKIHGYRIFKEFTWPQALPEFGRFNLIYGWNGSGKSTLCSILKSAQRASAITEGNVEFIFNGNKISGADLSKATLPQIRVFDRNTVSRNVFESASGSPDKLPPVYVFGEESAEKQRQVDALKASLSTMATIAAETEQKVVRETSRINDFATDRAREIKNLLITPDGELNNFNSANFKVHIKKIDVNQAMPFSAIERKSALELKDAKPLPSISIPEINFPDVMKLQMEVRDALGKTVVSNVIKELIENPAVSTWVNNGLSLHLNHNHSPACKFCEQPIPAGRIQLLEAHFNNQFREFSVGLENLKNRLEAAVAVLKAVSLPNASILYPELQGQYKNECALLNSNLLIVRNSLSALLSAIKLKQENMFKSLDLGEILLGGNGTDNKDKSGLTALLQAINSGLQPFVEFMGKNRFALLVSIINRHNIKTDTFSEKVTSARNRLKQHELIEALPKWLKLHDDLKAAEDEKSSAKANKREIEENISRLEADILQHRPPADEFNRELISYLGHAEIQVVVEATGYRLMRNGVPAMNLSEGERTAIAFLYFLKSLSDRSFDVQKGIVVIDDPISSLDSNSIYSAFGFLKRRLNNVGQLFVLTHNYTLLRQVRNWFKFANRERDKPARFYMLQARLEAGLRVSAIKVLDPFLQDYESEYHYLFKRVLEAGNFPGGAPLQTYYELPNLARRLLESFLVFKVPNEATLHARLEAIVFDGPKKTRLHRFLDTHSHAERISDEHDDASALAEAPEILRDLMSLIEHCDGGHYRRMKQAVSV